MTKETFVSFDEYKAQLTGANIDTRSATEILRELDEVEKQLERGDNAANGDGDI